MVSQLLLLLRRILDLLRPCDGLLRWLLCARKQLLPHDCLLQLSDQLLLDGMLRNVLLSDGMLLLWNLLPIRNVQRYRLLIVRI